MPPSPVVTHHSPPDALICWPKVRGAGHRRAWNGSYSPLRPGLLWFLSSIDQSGFISAFHLWPPTVAATGKVVSSVLDIKLWNFIFLQSNFTLWDVHGVLGENVTLPQYFSGRCAAYTVFTETLLSCDTVANDTQTKIY